MSSCTSIISNVSEGLANNLAISILNQDDPELVRDGAPAYLLLLDSLIEGDPENPIILSAAANLYASYGGVFVDDNERAKRMTRKALKYSNKSLCLSLVLTCSWDEYNYEKFVKTLAKIDKEYSQLLLNHAVASLAYTRAHSSDWNAIARLPHIQALLERYIIISVDDAMFDTVYTYLGIMVTLRPPALGGDYDKGKQYFELAIKLSEGKNLNAKVEYAAGYAKSLYDRDMHDQLLTEVLATNPVASGYTLTNMMAQEKAKLLLKSANDYF
tara:strand:+ start:827 stop:1639 length:813 start_codon:yes stop_codon:yes gene_type:complete